VLLDTTTGEADLPGMMLKRGGALREQDGWSLATLDERHEHRRRHGIVWEKPAQPRPSLRR
jgi:hypothetical protein